jgi:DNA polymerase-3 subunit beta
MEGWAAMQLVVERSEFLGALAHVAGVAPRAGTIPILTHLALRADRQGGSVRATDLDIEVTSPFKTEAVTEPGTVCVGARLLHDIIKRMPEGKPVALTLVEHHRLRVVSGKAKFELATLPDDDFPAFAAPAGKQTWQFEIEAQQLRRLFSGVKHAVSKDETRYYLNGVYLHATAEEPVHLKAVATNGHILALQACLAPTGAYGMPGIIVPAGTVAEMLKLLPDTDMLVTLIVSGAYVWLDLPSGVSLGSKLIDGTYPDYMRVIPRDHPNVMRCDADSLAAALDRVATISTEKGHQVVILMNPKGALTLTVNNAAVGTALDRVEVMEVNGKKTAIGFNHRYLAQMLSSYSGGTIELRYGGADNPTVMTLAGDSSQAGLQVLMPQRHNVDAEKLDEAA